MKNPTIAFTRRGLLLGSAAITLAACSGIIGPQSPPAQIYLLEPALGPMEGPAVSWQLAVDQPTCDDSLDTMRIAIYRGQTMDYYADAQWTDEAPKVIQTLTVEAFEKSGRISAVARDSDGLHADYLLQMEMRDFEARYSDPNGVPTVTVNIVARLLKSPSREVVAVLDSNHQTVASANSILAAVQAFNQATGQALEEIVGWALRAPSGVSEDLIHANEPAKPRLRRRHHAG